MSKTLNFAIKTAKKAGKLILLGSETNFKIKEKDRNDFVTNIDKLSEKLIIKEIKSVYPDHGILAEESFSGQSTAEQLFTKYKYIWIIDPLDGTTNFLHGLPFYAVSIALFKTLKADRSKNFDYLSGEIILGVVFCPKTNELFYAEKSHGAFLNDKKIKVSKTEKVKNAFTATGFPPRHEKENLPYFAKILKKAQAVRRLGSAALDLCYTAAGRFDAYWEFGLKPWDIAAGALILEEAGGRTTDTNGMPLDLFGEDILATNNRLHKEMIKTLRTC